MPTAAERWRTRLLDEFEVGGGGALVRQLDAGLPGVFYTCILRTLWDAFPAPALVDYRATIATWRVRCGAPEG